MECLDLFQSRPDHEHAFLPVDQVAAASKVIDAYVPWTRGYYPVVEGTVERTADNAKPADGAFVSGGSTKFGVDMDCVVEESIRRVRAGTPVTVTHVAYVPEHARASDAVELILGSDGPVTAFTRDGYRGAAVLEDDVLTLPHVVAGSDERRAADAIVLPEKASDPHVSIMKEQAVSVKVADGQDPRDMYEVLKPFAVDVLRSVTHGDLDEINDRLEAVGRGIFGESSGKQESDAVRYLLQRIAAKAVGDDPLPVQDPHPGYKNSGYKSISYAGPPNAITKDDVRRLSKHNAGALSEAAQSVDRALDDWKSIIEYRKPVSIAVREEYPQVNNNVVIVNPLQTDDDPHVRNMHAVDTSVMTESDGVQASDALEDDPDKIGSEGVVRKAYAKVMTTCSMVNDKDLVDDSVAAIVYRWQRRVPRGPRLDMLRMSFSEVGEEAALIAALDTMSAESMEANPQKLISDVGGRCAVDCAITSVRTFRPALAKVSSPKDYDLSVSGLVKYVGILLDKAGLVKGIADTIKAGETAATKLPPNTDKILENLKKAKTTSVENGSSRQDPTISRKGYFVPTGRSEFPQYSPAKDSRDAKVSFSSHVKVERLVMKTQTDKQGSSKNATKLGKLPDYLKSIVYGGSDAQQIALLNGACPGFVALARTKLPSDFQKSYEQYMSSKDAADFASKLAKFKSNNAKHISDLRMPSRSFSKPSDELLEFVRMLYGVDSVSVELFDLYATAYARPIKANQSPQDSEVMEVAPGDEEDDVQEGYNEEDTANDDYNYDSDDDDDS